MSDAARKAGGGCQCAAVRFAVAGALGQPGICHCRMCQKAFGAFDAPLVAVDENTLQWRRGESVRLQSSSHVKRGFHNTCGTPLTYEAREGIALSIAAFDEPEKSAPQIRFGVESMLPCFDTLHTLPRRASLEDPEALPFLKTMVSCRQSDLDTVEWLPPDPAFGTPARKPS